MDKYIEIVGKDIDEFVDLLVNEIHKRFPDNNYDVKISNTISTDNHLEIEADKFATNYLISSADYKRFAPSRYTSDDEIVEFAKTIGIHPGIVVGRLQHDGILAQNRCSKLKEKYVIKIKHTV